MYKLYLKDKKFEEALNKIFLIKANYLWLSLAPQMILKLLILLNGCYVKKSLVEEVILNEKDFNKIDDKASKIIRF